MNRKVVLASRPEGLPALRNFRLVSEPMPVPGPGQFLMRNTYLGLAPAARLRMTERESYAPPLKIGDVVYGQTVGEVVESKHPDYAPGDRVMTLSGGWQEYSVSDGTGASKILPEVAAETVWLGAMGTSGMTAWVGLKEFGKLKANETVVISAASGAVGSAAGQIAKLKGCRAVGVAGGPAKCAYVVDHFGFDACVDYRSPDFTSALTRACPSGVDVFFDNVGGSVRDAIWALMNTNGRIIVCGMISEYNDAPHPGPAWFPILSKTLTISGFLMSRFYDQREAFVEEMGAWFRSGQIKIKEDIVEGLENTPAAFIAMMSGANFGKTIVKL